MIINKFLDKFHSVQQHGKKDEIVQANPDELDPSQWTGNQRVLHFGPMAQRDPFLYYYPRGWDLLYPAQFGFFPYRTRFKSEYFCVVIMIDNFIDFVYIDKNMINMHILKFL